MRWLYSILLYLATPFLLLHWSFRGLRNPAYWKRWKERFGFHRQNPKPGILLHAVSVGEVNAAAALIKALRQHYPELPITVTCVTPTGSERIQALFGDEVEHGYLPLDLPFSMERFFRRIKPCLLVVMETEIWPNFFHTATRHQIPIMIANARLSQRSLNGYRWMSGLVGTALKQVTTIAAQSEADRQRIIQAGANTTDVITVGNLKFDLTLPAGLAADGLQLRQQWGDKRPVIIAASTHEKDDQVVLTAYQQILDKQPDSLLLLVPRHPERFARSYALAQEFGFRTRRRSEHQRCNPETECFLIDTMGELVRFCAACDVAFVGGSFEPIGGHNVLEPAALGKPVIVGPHMFNFQEITDNLLLQKAAIQVHTAAELAKQITYLIDHPEEKAAMGSAALNLVRSGRGALQHNLTLIRSLLSTQATNQEH